MSGNPQPRRLTEGYIRTFGYLDRPYTVRDTAVTGLLVQVNQKSKSYKVQRDLYTGERGRRRFVKTVRRTLGTTDEITLDEARTRAQELIAQVKRGEDPNARPDDKTANPDAWTVRRMYDEYTADMRARDCRERTIEDVLYVRAQGAFHIEPLPNAQEAVGVEADRHIGADRGTFIENTRPPGPIRPGKRGWIASMAAVGADQPQSSDTQLCQPCSRNGPFPARMRWIRRASRTWLLHCMRLVQSCGPT